MAAKRLFKLAWKCACGLFLTVLGRNTGAMALRFACVLSLLVVALQCGSMMAQDSMLKVSYPPLQNAKTKAHADLTQVLNAVKGALLPNNAMPETSTSTSSTIMDVPSLPPTTIAPPTTTPIPMSVP
ncbi:g5969 [Coccomyxa viridis]|uniref:G5969 protein n=1 Tax=Coccomyxa viridis TaxID=1274662 RepID=A0ABP1FU78_9CHLO